MKTQEITLPDGSIGVFRADQSDSEIKSIIKKEFPDAYEQETSTLRQLGYGFASSRSDLGNLGDIIESYIPTGRFFNPTETYGEEFMQMEPGSQERRDFLTKRRLDMVNKEYADVVAANETDTLSAKIGNFGGAIASPTTLIPIGQGYKAVAGVSALLGAEYDILDQYMKTGKVDILALIGHSSSAVALQDHHTDKNRLRLVLGLEAKNPAIILKDANIGLAVDECLKGSLSYNGQRCTALKVIYVHKDVKDIFLNSFIQKVDSLSIKNPDQEDAFITPLPDPSQPKYL